VAAAKRNKLLVVAFVVLCLSLALAACAPRQANRSGDSAGDETDVVLELPVWSTDSECTSCHATEVESGSDNVSTYSLHTTVVCGECHTDTDGKLTKAHERYATAAQPAKLKWTEVASENCQSCHDDDEVLKVATVGTTVLTDDNGTTVNPHDLPQIAEHQESITCSDCHKMHKPEPIAEVAPKTCTTCHHQNVYECGTCH
jgi:hypothetical protein